MSKKPKKPKPLPSLLVREGDDDADVFRAAVERLDAKAVEAKLAGAESAPGASAATSGRRGSEATQEIDLHRHTVDEARRVVDATIGRWISERGGAAQLRLKVITGKGRHSGPGGPVLAREIHRYFSTRYAAHIVSIETSPAEAVIEGLPLRGHFHVILRR